MTTVAYDGRTLAADRMLTEGSVKEPAAARKVWRCGDKLLSGAGEYAAMVRAAEALRTGRPLSSVRNLGGTDFIVVDKTGKAHVYEGATLLYSTRRPTALGAGRLAALAAMMAGADAAKAVRIAARLVTDTGGGVTAMAVSRRRKRG